MILMACPTCLPLRPRSNAILRAWWGWRPMRGSMGCLRMASGFSSATFSISTPPSAEAMRTLRRVSRSVVMAR